MSFKQTTLGLPGGIPGIVMTSLLQTGLNGPARTTIKANPI